MPGRNLLHQGSGLRDRVLDATTLLGWWHLLEKHERGEPIEVFAKNTTKRPEPEDASANSGGIKLNVGDQQPGDVAGLL